MMKTPRQRWLAIFQGGALDRVPTDYWSTWELHQKLVAAVGGDGEELSRKLGIDHPRNVWPRRLREHHPDDPLADMWGIRHQTIDYGTGQYGEVAYHPLANMTSVAEVHQFRWPSPDDFDYSTVSDALAKDDGYRIVKGGGYEPFLLYCAMRGMEQASGDLLISPEIADAVLGHLFDFAYEQNRRIWQAGGGKIDMMYLAEDLGGQHRPLFGLETYRRFLLPGQKKMADWRGPSASASFTTPTARARVFVPDLIDVVGMDILNPLQCGSTQGMELPGLVRDFGKHVAFHGGIDNQQTVPLRQCHHQRPARSAERCQDHGKRPLDLHLCHNIQAVSPVENVLAMYDEAAKLAAPRK